MGLLTHLTYEGIWVDFGKNADLVAAEQSQIHAAYPRLRMAHHLAEEVLAHGARSETAAPPYALAFHLAQERAADGITTMERGVVGGPWGVAKSPHRRCHVPIPYLKQFLASRDSRGVNHEKRSQAVSDFAEFTFRAQPGFDEALAREIVTGSIPVRTIVMYCFDPRAAGAA